MVSKYYKLVYKPTDIFVSMQKIFKTETCFFFKSRSKIKILPHCQLQHPKPKRVNVSSKKVSARSDLSQNHNDHGRKFKKAHREKDIRN